MTGSGILTAPTPRLAALRAIVSAARSGYGNFDWAAWGDSMTGGHSGPVNGATQDRWADSYVGMLEDAFVSLGVPIAARALPTSESEAVQAGRGIWTGASGLNRGGPPWTVNGNVTVLNAGWPFIVTSDVVGAFPANISHTFLSDPAATSLDILHAVYASTQQSAKFSYALNGGTPVQVTLPASTSDFGYQTLSFTGLSGRGVQRVDFGGQLASDGVTGQAGTFQPLTAIERFPTFGQRIYRSGWWGKQATHWGALQTAGANSPTDKLKSIAGGWNGTAWGAGFPAAPDLLIVSIGYNDCYAPGTYTPSQLHRFLYRLASAYYRGRPNGILVFCAQYGSPEDAYADLTNGSQSADWLYYQEAIRRAAETVEAVLVDLRVRWRSNAAALGYLTDGIHPVRKGHADWAGAIMEGIGLG